MNFTMFTNLLKIFQNFKNNSGIKKQMFRNSEIYIHLKKIDNSKHFHGFKKCL